MLKESKGNQKMSTTAKEVKERKARKAKTVEEALTSKDFYNIKPVLEKSPDIVVLIGQRSNGKTYSTLYHCLDTFNKLGRTFVYVRRWAEDISVKNMDKLFSPLPVEKIFGRGCYIKFWRGAFVLKRRELNEDEEEYDEPFEEQTLGWAISLNAVAHTKSQAFPGVKNVVLDEFLQLKTERQLTGEFDAWEQTLSSVLRTTTDATIFLLGNTVSKYSPYFAPYGIEINKMKQGEIVVIELPNEVGDPTRVVFEWCEYNPKVGKRTSKYVRGSKMAKTGEWELQDVSNIPHTDNEQATEQLLCTMFDYVMGITIGIFVRYARWFTLEVDNGIYYQVPHEREFLVIRQTNRQSSFYHLTNVKNLTYNCYSVLDKMWRQIEEDTGYDIENELQMGRVYCEDSFTADHFYHSFLQYKSVSLKDLL